MWRELFLRGFPDLVRCICNVGEVKSPLKKQVPDMRSREPEHNRPELSVQSSTESRVEHDNRQYTLQPTAITANVEGRPK
jgi:hypothetical protein